MNRAAGAFLREKKAAGVEVSLVTLGRKACDFWKRRTVPVLEARPGQPLSETGGLRLEHGIDAAHGGAEHAIGAETAHHQIALARGQRLGVERGQRRVRFKRGGAQLCPQNRSLPHRA